MESYARRSSACFEAPTPEARPCSTSTTCRACSLPAPQEPRIVPATAASRCRGRAASSSHRGARDRGVAEGDRLRCEDLVGRGAQSKARCSGASTCRTCSASWGRMLVSGVPLDRAAAAIAAPRAVAGRMQRLGGVGRPLVVVDYAHTPDALEKTLVALKDVARAARRALDRGCSAPAGDRDRGQAPADGRRSPRATPTPSLSPATTRAARTRPRSSRRSDGHHRLARNDRGPARGDRPRDRAGTHPMSFSSPGRATKPYQEDRRAAASLLRHARGRAGARGMSR